MIKMKLLNVNVSSNAWEIRDRLLIYSFIFAVAFNNLGYNAEYVLLQHDT